ncbi:hypothetical protein [Hymenobacter glacieicola]|uniref:STAS/SEC14 domain-containing protein n=1 Tax=Hymenobacter glacieicola TaxID=1562124 RepID=A0ABQ1WUI5_9BACT|nr:hypothetical protein [Hymenobacter glacieicola]GGG45619.1 hypothetical protein GCM10011378_22340 [Hymenobacter glacieicola]
MSTLKEKLVNNNCFQIWYETDHNLLQVQWQALSSTHQAKDYLLDVLEKVRSQRIQRLLLNLDGMPELSVLDCYVLEKRVLQQLPNLQLQQLALVLTSYMQHQALLESSVMSPPFDMQVFDDSSTALEWLRNADNTEDKGWRVSRNEYEAA